MLDRTDLTRVFQNLSNFLDIPESQFERARNRYQAIGNWLGRDESVISDYEPEIYPQGSFQLGTVTKPITNKDEYDIDLVCRLHLSKTQITQKRLKELVGLELANYVVAHQMNHSPEERRRCWRLNYSDGAQFHLDALPSVPQHFSKLTNNEIAITDNERPNYTLVSDDWVCCNPIDYAEWFRNRMIVRLHIMRKEFAERYKADISDVPEYQIKTPLQRAVQILKRHRDITFDGDEDDKPTSILITTLAAHAYDNEADIVEALVGVVTKMSDYIEDRDGVLWVANPVNLTENFADKWPTYPKRQEIFLEWLNRVEIDILEVVNSIDLQITTKSLKRQFGEVAVNEALKELSEPFPILKYKENNRAVVELQKTFLVPHRQPPPWKTDLNSHIRVEVAARVERNGFRPKPYYSNGEPLLKSASLRFTANTNTKKSYSVFWQVVNTGTEASQANALRGDFYETSFIQKGKRVRLESTSYTGKHWVECFIVENGVCVARSGEFVINIA